MKAKRHALGGVGDEWFSSREAVARFLAARDALELAEVERAEAATRTSDTSPVDKHPAAIESCR